MIDHYIIVTFQAMSISADEERGCENGEVRLQGGVDPSDGHVEFCVDRVWGRVCSDEWDINYTRVVCQQLGFDPEGMYHVCDHQTHFNRIGTLLRLRRNLLAYKC